MTLTSRGILTYLLLVFTLSLGPYLLVIHAQHLAVGFGLVVGVLMWMPATAACLTCRILGIDIASLGWNWRPVRFEVLAYIVPVLYALPVYIACWTLVPHSYAFPEFASGIGTAFGFPGSPYTATFLLGLPVFATFGIVRSIAAALGEEIGWRGFLLPRLTGKFGWRLGCLISGCIWAAWHYPLLLFADYNSGTPKPFALTCFTLMVISDAYILGWLRLRSKCLWPCAMLHATHNLFIQGIFDRSTAQSGQALYVTTEFGFGLVITTAITAFILWRISKPEQDSISLQPESVAA